MASELNHHKASLVFGAEAILGEGPVWDQRNQVLYWVDIEQGTLHAHNPSDNSNQQWHFDEMLGAAVPTDNGNMLLALETGLAVFHFGKSTIDRLGVLENEDAELRFNDGKCDPNGNFWVGTMHKELQAGKGNFYRVTPALNSSLQIPGTTISNGMAWSPDRSTFYYIDTGDYYVRAYDYELSNSSITNERVLFKIPDAYGGPDGMTIDSEGKLWIAHWGGACVRRWDPLSGKVLERIAVNAPHVTSCCFAGPELNMLYITTARSGLTREQLAQFPDSGGLFAFKTGVSGLKTNFFKDH
ncbi:SMP-30/gluconolactonase/LRE family protein [Poritiphilus flavus]|uniref:SMP-30/gluconolactonase/LRE family protein n=1 Tax=Poritiphilus flavus TaxID=2697053 RepID=A0A6L9E8I1_9FLAO|nr:SMP-30/gluconolactonase/LRE family protein [Poritiphilus flavus]NAS11026.1 SMP-30/gluconolactonase/LRE family protein [Poritiphilus flavus]